ncbi:hypothetical protein Tco_0403294 [Tanacetum coccineum]
MLRSSSQEQTIQEHLRMLRSSSRMRKKTGESVGSGWLLNDDIMESLFGCDLGGSGEKEEGRKPATIPMVQDNTVLNPKKSQSATILLRALIVTREEISSALLTASSQLSSKRWFARAIVRISSTMSTESSTRNHFKVAVS